MMTHDSATDVFDLRAPAAAWCVAHTRPRCEKRVVEFCGRQALPAYLPLRRRLHRYGGRERVFFSPLFPGYAFCLADQQQRLTLKQNRHVANVLTVVEQEKLIAQLRQIRRALELGDAAEVLPYLQEGKPVRVKGGTFKGLEGVVVRVKGKTRVVLNVDMINRSMAVEVESDLLEPA
jgi:transcriptional antiterminator RfaH